MNLYDVVLEAHNGARWMHNKLTEQEVYDMANGMRRYQGGVHVVMYISCWGG